jgi:AmiR/NasT family two-component response regulator
MTQRGFIELLSTLGSDQHHAQDMKAELEQKKALERATGMLMERHGLSADTAAERIRQTAVRQGIAVEEAAARFLRQPSADVRRRSGR